MKRSSLDVVLGPFCTAAKRTGAVIQIETEDARIWNATLRRFPRGKIAHLVTGKAAQGAADAMERALESEAAASS